MTPSCAGCRRSRQWCPFPHAQDSTPDTGCGLKVFARETFLRLPNFDHIHRFLPALVIRGGGAVVSVPVNHRSRERGVSSTAYTTGSGSASSISSALRGCSVVSVCR